MSPSTEAPSTATTLAEDNKAADRWFIDQIINGQDLESIGDIVADDFVEQNPPPGQGPGRDGLRDFLAQMFRAFPDLTWTVHEMVAEGDRVAAWSTWTGTHREDFLGIGATGRSVTVEAWTFDRFHDGKMCESRIIMDVMGMMQQLQGDA